MRNAEFRAGYRTHCKGDSRIARGRPQRGVPTRRDGSPSPSVRRGVPDTSIMGCEGRRALGAGSSPFCLATLDISPHRGIAPTPTTHYQSLLYKLKFVKETIGSTPKF